MTDLSYSPVRREYARSLALVPLHSHLSNRRRGSRVVAAPATNDDADVDDDGDDDGDG